MPSAAAGTVRLHGQCMGRHTPGRGQVLHGLVFDLATPEQRSHVGGKGGERRAQHLDLHVVGGVVSCSQLARDEGRVLGGPTASDSVVRVLDAGDEVRERQIGGAASTEERHEQVGEDLRREVVGIRLVATERASEAARRGVMPLVEGSERLGISIVSNSRHERAVVVKPVDAHCDALSVNVPAAARCRFPPLAAHKPLGGPRKSVTEQVASGPARQRWRVAPIVAMSRLRCRDHSGSV